MTTNILASTTADLVEMWQEIGATFGSTYEWYSASTGNNLNPISDANDSGSFQCYFDRDPTFPTKRAREYGKPEYFCAYDRAGPQVGDYLVGTDTYVIIDQDDLTPSKVVMCNTLVDFYRPGPTSINGVRETTKGLGTMIAQQWPVSLLAGSRGEKATIDLPDAVRQPWVTILCPTIPGVILMNGDKLQDSSGNKYQISMPEDTLLGNRLTAKMDMG